MKRRTMLALGAVAVTACRTAPSLWRSFTNDEAATVDAICERIIPGDQDSGAHDAGVVNYIDIQLARRFKRYLQTYRDGITSTNAASRATFGKPFVELAAGQQTLVLEVIEKSEKPFFDLILNHTRQGFYGDPRHGGNRNRASWKMVRLQYPPVRGRS